MVDLRRQYEGIRAEVAAGFEQILESGAFINGPVVGEFTARLADYLGSKHVIPCANGTDALQAALMALPLQAGDEIITTPFTFVATAEVIALLHLKPVFVDIDPQTFNINPDLIEAAITPRTRCIMPVHLYGQCAAMEQILDIATRHRLFVIEDNAQSIGADYTFSDGKRAKSGTMGHIGCTSFYPSKNLGAYGDAGAIFCNDDALAQQLKMVCNHGQLQKYHSDIIGINSRLDSFQGVVLNAKLKKLDTYIAARQAAADQYDQYFRQAEDNITIPYRAPYSTHVFHQYTLIIRNKNRDILKQQLEQAGVPTMIYYPYPMHLNRAFAYLGYKKGDFPVAEAAAAHTISLPMHSEMNEAQIKFIGETLLHCLHHTPAL